MVLELLVGLLGFGLVIAIPVLIILFFAGIKIVMQYEKGVKFTLGKYSGIMEPGLKYVIPLIQSWQRLDTRILTVDIPSQEVMTRDNIPVNINAVIYFRVQDPKKAILNVANYMFAVSKYGQTSLRDIAGEVELDELLSKREEISKKLKDIVDKATDPWGVDVTDIKLQDIELPEQLKRTIMKQAESERERRALVIKSRGEVTASTNLAKAAKTLATSSGALHLRTLQTLNDLSSDQSNTVVFAVPVEILQAWSKLKK